MEMTLGTWHIAIERTRPNEADLRRMYDADAARWHNSISRLGYVAAYADLFRRLWADGSLSALPQAAQVLDCGIGTAGLSLALARQSGIELQVDGVDISPQMLQRASQLLAEAGLTLTPHCRSAAQLTFADDTFDLVMSAHMLEHVADPLATLREMVRVLRPGTPLLLVVSRPCLFTSLIQLRWRYMAYRPGEMVRMMNEAGLSRINLYELSGWVPCRSSLAYVGVK